MEPDHAVIRTWARVGFAAGLVACISYPLLITVSMPAPVALALAAVFGCGLSIASIGLYHVIKLHRRTVTLQLGAIFNIIAGAVVNMMMVVQMAVGETLRGHLGEAVDAATKESLRRIWIAVDQVQLGLDVVWDIYIGLGSLFFAVNMLTHPRFGRIFGWPGASIAVALLILNFYTFPTPPAQGGLVDLGPVLGLWYLAVTIQVGRSFRWVDEMVGKRA